MKAELYYTPPSAQAFEDLRINAIRLWNGYDNEDYVNEKVGKIKYIQNIGDNFMFIFAMFDHNNQRAISKMVTEETRQAIKERLIDGGMPESFMPF